jgi:hypothetical protein
MTSAELCMTDINVLWKYKLLFSRLFTFGF